MSNKATLSRRGFVKASAMTAAVAALGGVTCGSLVEADEAYAASGTERKMVRTICHGCTKSCIAIAYMEDGVVVKLEGDPEAPVNKGSMCLKGQSQLHTCYSPRHVLHPMKRVGEKGTSNEWEVISWDEAIDLAAQHIAATQEKYGPYALWAAAGGGGNYVSAVSAAWPYVFGGTTQVSPGAIQCAMPRCCIANMMFNVDSISIADCEVPEPFNDHDPQMELFVMWGTQPTTSQTAQAGHGMADARVDRGLKTIVIDPVFTADATKATIWLPVRPGSDTALILSWIRYIIENNLYDEEFCKYWTNLPFLINPETKLPYEANDIWPDYVNPALDPNDVFETPAYVCFDKKTNSIQPFPYTAPEDCPVDPELFATVDVNGVEAKTGFQIWKEGADEWTLEKAGEVCWLDPAKIEEAVRLYATTEKAGISHGVWSDQQECSAAAPVGTMAMECMTGHIYKPGTTVTKTGPNSRTTTRATGPYNFKPVEYQDSHNRYGLGWTLGWTKRKNDEWLEEQKDKLRAKGLDADAMQAHVAQSIMDRCGSVEHKGANWWNQSANSCARDAILTGEPYPLKCMYYVSGNLLSNIGEPYKWVEAMADQDFIVHQYANMTSFDIEFTDLFLPTNEWLEYNQGRTRTAQLNKTFVAQSCIHLGETLPPEMPAALIVDRVCEILGGRDKVFDPDFLVDVAECYTDSAAKKDDWAVNRYHAENWQDLIDNYDKYLPQVVEPEDFWQYYQHLDIAEDGLPVGFGTESRKCEPYASFLVKMGRTGWPFLYPFEMEAAPQDYSPITVHKEQAENPFDDTEYPLVMTNGRVHYFHHGTVRHAPFIRELYPAPEILVHPDTAAQYGIEHGDWVKVTSRRASINAKANCFAGIHPGVVKMERFWNPECFDSTQDSVTGGWQECGVSCLTYDGTLGDVFGSATYRAYQVKIEPGERPDRVWVEPKEFEPFMPTLLNEPVTAEVY